MLGNLGLNGRRTLFVTPALNRNVYLSGRNIPNNRVMNASDINTYEIMKANNLILTESAVKAISETFNKD
jgi:large subunit ribosomal protein L4